MNFKKYHVSKNLCPMIFSHRGVVDDNGGVSVQNTRLWTDMIPVSASSSYYIAIDGKASNDEILRFNRAIQYDASGAFISRINTGANQTATFTTAANCAYIVLDIRTISLSVNLSETDVNTIQMNTGSTPLPYEPYSSEVWHDIPHYQHKTATDTLTLPAVVYPNAATATVGLKGQAVQSTTPTPDNPVMPQGTGDLETVGAKAGQYKIPISSANTTTPVYLGEVESTRRIKKSVLTGQEEWQFFSDNLGSWQFYINNISLGGVAQSSCASSIAPYGATATTRHQYDYGGYLVTSGNGVAFQMKGAKDTFTGITAWKAYLAQQYAAGTPVTVWYVLATEETGIVNEPLMKIGDYADEVSGITIPTIAGANTFSVGTTVQPSEVTVNYKGWHPVANVHERENGAWD